MILMDNIIYASTLFWVVYVYVQNIKYILDRIAEEKKLITYTTCKIVITIINHICKL